MSEAVAKVEQALCQLYNDPSAENKREAQRWLMQVQNSQEAWQLCWILLQHQKEEVKFFGASILNHKIVRAWKELPVDQYEQLRLELFKAILTHAQGPRIVRSKLCVTLADLVLFTVPDHWPNAVSSIIETMKKASLEIGDNWQAVLLEMLTVLPEEFDTISSNVISFKKGILRSELRSSVPTVLQLLESILVSNVINDLKSTAINCLKSWSQFELPINEIDGLVVYLFQSLENEELFEASLAALTEIISSPYAEEYPNAVKKFLSRVVKLHGLTEAKLEADNMEASLQLCQLLVATLQMNVKPLLNVLKEDDVYQTDSLAALQMLLEFTSLAGNYPVDENCSQITLHFWEELMESITMTYEEDSELNEQLLEFFDTIISGLINTLPQKSQYPPENSWDAWTEDEKDDFIKCRDDINDLVISFGGSQPLQMELLQHLCSNLEGVLRESQPPWQPLEAILFLLQSFAACLTTGVTSQHSPFLQTMLGQLSRIPSQCFHPVFTRTVLSLLGSLGTWLNGQPGILKDIVPMVLGSLKDPSVAPTAALAFKDICEDCAEQLCVFSGQLMSVCQEALTNSTLEKRECTRVISAVCIVISFLPAEELSSHLGALTGSRVERLEQLAQQQLNPANRSVVELEVSLIGVLCQFINDTATDSKQQHPVLPIFVRVWPSLKALVTQWCNDEVVVESVCITWNKAIRALQEQYGILVEDNANIILQVFTGTLNPKLLDTATQLVRMFGRDSSFSQLLLEFLERLCSVCLRVFQADMRTNPDTLCMFFTLLTKTLKTCPVLLAERHTFVVLFEFGCAVIRLPELPTIKKVAVFFDGYITAASTIELFGQMLESHGKTLVGLILQGIAGLSPRSHLDPLTDVLFSMKNNCVTLLSTWLQELLQQENFPSANLTLVQKQNLASIILREHTSYQLREKMNQFSILCRGFQGSGYPTDST